MRLGNGSTKPEVSKKKQGARRRSVFWLLAPGLLLLGCLSSKARQSQELLEADLRSQERHIQELKDELDRKEGVIHGLDYEVERLQQSAAGVKPPPGEPQVPGVIKDIALGRLTGGFQQNAKVRFDDAMQIILEPRDSDGSTIKAPGSVHVDLFEITPQGLKAPLSSWDITSRELRRMWDQPLIGGSGYRIVLPFKAIPTTEKLRVIVRFMTLDGKLFEAERDFSIKLPMGLPRPGLPIGLPGGYTAITPGRTAVPLVTSEPYLLPMPQRNEPLAQEVKGGVKEEKKVHGHPMPVIQFPASSTLGTEGPPPLPAPPEVPSLDQKKPEKVPGAEELPAPHQSPETERPLVPGNNTANPQAVPSVRPLTAPPPQSWRERQSDIVQAQYVEEPAIKLSRPIVKSPQAPE
jgi:hypothetical protein